MVNVSLNGRLAQFELNGQTEARNLWGGPEPTADGLTLMANFCHLPNSPETAWSIGRRIAAIYQCLDDWEKRPDCRITRTSRQTHRQAIEEALEVLNLRTESFAKIPLWCLAWCACEVQWQIESAASDIDIYDYSEQRISMVEIWDKAANGLRKRLERCNLMPVETPCLACDSGNIYDAKGYESDCPTCQGYGRLASPETEPATKDAMVQAILDLEEED